MVLTTQFELKSRCWSEDNKTNNMSVSTDIIFQPDEPVTNQCFERNGFMELQNGYCNIISSNGYYGYQPLTASMKQEHFIYNDCEMSMMNCDNNVQGNIRMENTENDSHMVISSECNPDSLHFQNVGNQVNVTSSFMPQTSTVCCSSRRKRTHDTNYDFKQCSKKSRQQESMVDVNLEYLFRTSRSIPKQDVSRCLMCHYV